MRAASGSGSVDLEPTFDVPIVNVTVVRGQIALLPCSIDFLGKYKASTICFSSLVLPPIVLEYEQSIVN